MKDNLNYILLENDAVSVKIDKENGSIISIYDNKTHTEIISETRLAESFKLLIPLPEKESNYIRGKLQKLSAWSCEGNKLVLDWQGPMSNEEGTFEISLKLTIQLAGEEVTFDAIIDNRTECQITEVWCPVLGGITGFGERKQTKAMIPSAGWITNEDLFTNFQGYYDLGTPVPEYTYQYPGKMPMQWVDFYNPTKERGVYFACHDAEPRYKVIRFELQPGIGRCRKDSWPRPEELVEDIPVGMLLHWVLFPYIKPGETFEAPKVVVRFHDGDWHGASGFYREWFNSQFKTVGTDPWIHQIHAFMDTMFLLSEGVIKFRFSDIPQWAASAAKCGMKAVLISGWDLGGHDSCYPYYEIDPRLGTWEDLKSGIEEVHKMGMKVFFFVNDHPVDTSTQWYKDELHKYVVKDPWGNLSYIGFGMGTVGARMNITSRKFANADPAFPQVRKLLVQQFARLAAIGADAVHIDKQCWSYHFYCMNFNPEIEKMGLTPDKSIWQGVLKLCEEILTECRSINPNFCISTEGAWDQIMQYTDVGWMWHNPWEDDHSSPFKYTFPQWTPCYAVCQPYDYILVNNAIRYGYQLMVGPMDYTSSMDDKLMKGLSEYIKEVLSIRDELKETIYSGIFLDKQQVSVEKAGENIFYNTHLNPATGKRACILTNSDDVPHEVSVCFEGNRYGEVSVYAPFASKSVKQLPAMVTIPPQRFVILLEK